jgi:hypothetical protein
MKSSLSEASPTSSFPDETGKVATKVKSALSAAFLFSFSPMRFGKF